MKAKKIVTYGFVLLLIIFSVRLFLENPFISDDLVKLSVTSREHIKTTSGRYTRYGYSFLTDEYQAKFTIDNCVNFISDRNIIKEINRGDKLEIMFERYYLDNLSDDTDVPIFSLSVNSYEMFSPDSYLTGQTKQNHRHLALFSILIIALTLTNIDKIKSRISWTIIITYIVAILILIQLKIL